jgi:hypothetical protein
MTTFFVLFAFFVLVFVVYQLTRARPIKKKIYPDRSVQITIKDPYGNARERTLLIPGKVEAKTHFLNQRQKRKRARWINSKL